MSEMIDEEIVVTLYNNHNKIVRNIIQNGNINTR